MLRTAVGARPGGQSLSFSRHRGFSLVELMMTLVLVGVSISLALPSYRNMVEKRQVTNGAEQLAAFINTVQGVAMKTNSRVNVSYDHTDSADWCIGAVSGTLPCNCRQTTFSAPDYCKIRGESFVFTSSVLGNDDLIHSVSGDGEYVFDETRGKFFDSSDSLTMDLRSASGDFRLNLVVNNTGRVILCSDGDHAIPGYEACPGSGDGSPDTGIDPGFEIDLGFETGTDPVTDPQPEEF